MVLLYCLADRFKQLAISALLLYQLARDWLVFIDRLAQKMCMWPIFRDTNQQLGLIAATFVIKVLSRV